MNEAVVSQSDKKIGRMISRSQSVDALLKVERDHNVVGRFAELDLLVGTLLTRGLRGDRIVELRHDDMYVNTVFVLGLSEAERRLIDDRFAVETQEVRGLWTLPEKASLHVGLASFRWAYSRWGRFGTGLAMEERGSVKLRSTPDAVFYWGILEVLFDTLFIPLQLCGPLAGELTRDEQLERWATANALYEALGFGLEEQLSLMRYGGGWGKLSSSGQLSAKLQLLDAMGQQANVHMGQRYRAFQILPLITNYYKKVKKNGPVKKKQALTKALERTLSAYWSGDWLSFIDYLGEVPHPGEQITTALPRIKPMVRQSERIEEIAAQQGLPEDVVRSVAASYWRETGGASPVEQRVRCLKRYWHIFDELHARQTTGMQSLWGLVVDNRHITLSRADGPTFSSTLYLKLLPEDLLLEINHLWGTTMKPKWPDRILTEPFPYQVMVETMGPALRFFEGCSLTAWYLCAHGSGRTDMKGLAHYHRKEIAALDRLGTPIDQQLFSDLIEAESKLGLLERVEEQPLGTNHEMSSGTLGMGVQWRRSGSEELLKRVTSYRHIWTEEHLKAYLRARWESEITQAGRAYNIMIQESEGRLPTAKQFARAAAPATNHWFGGNVCGLYAAMREKCPTEPKRVQLMPDNVAEFAKRLYDLVPSQPFTFPDGKDATSYRASYIEEIANLGVKYIQMEEGLGRPPEMKELGEKFPYYSKAMPGDLAEAWKTFVRAIKDARESLSQKA